MSLRYQEQNGKATIFVDPINPQNQLVASFDVSKKPVGKDRVRTVSSTITQAHFFEVTPCAGDCGPKIYDNMRGSVSLKGTTEAQKKLLWDALKANVDAAFEQGLFNGLRLPLTFSGFQGVVTPSPAE